ncbi:MAG: hypothetical protein WDN75_20135 [Bacteroidota bacterium]
MEVARICYTMRDYDSAYKYYLQFLDLRKKQHLDIFKNAELTIAVVFSKTGHSERSEEFVKVFKKFADEDPTMYKNLHLAIYYIYRGDDKKAIEHLALFSREDNYQYWVLLLQEDPLVDTIKERPEFRKVMKDIEEKFWRRNGEIRKNLEGKGLM